MEIVKYVPEVVKVENVYAYSSEKSRKVEFHLRVLIKACLLYTSPSPRDKRQSRMPSSA